MAQSLALWAFWAYNGPAASSSAALITVHIVSEIQRIVHPPCDVVSRAMHRREHAQSKPASRRKAVLRDNLRQRVTASALRAIWVARQPQKPAKKREPSLNSSCP